MQAYEEEGGRAQRQLRPVRRYPRYMFSIPVTVRHRPPSRLQNTRGMTLDISQGGVSAIVAANLLVGEVVEIDLPLPTGLLNALANVRYKTADRCGFEFIGLSPQEQQQIVGAVCHC